MRDAIGKPRIRAPLGGAHLIEISLDPKKEERKGNQTLLRIRENPKMKIRTRILLMARAKRRDR